MIQGQDIPLNFEFIIEKGFSVDKTNEKDITQIDVKIYYSYILL